MGSIGEGRHELKILEVNFMGHGEELMVVVRRTEDEEERMKSQELLKNIYMYEVCFKNWVLFLKSNSRL